MSRYDYALYNRGFMLSVEKFSSPKADWKEFVLEPSEKIKYYVCYDGQNEIAYYADGGKWCFIIGMAMDTSDWHMELDLIVKKCVECLLVSDESFYDYIDELNGRFFMVFGDGDRAIALNDATATRSVYYHENKCIVASHYGIIADITGEGEHAYFKSFNAIEKHRPWTLPGDMTPYENIRILTANHEINLSAMSIRRFWPRGEHKRYSAKEILQTLPHHFKNQMNTLARYATPIISVTGGNDSKVTMSACRDVRDKSVFFTFENKHTNTKNLDQRNRHSDCEYARYLTELYNLKFIPLTLNPPLDPEMNAIADKNHYHSHIRSAIPEYVNELPDGVHVQSNLLEIIRDLTYVYPKPPKHNSKYEIMAGWMMYWNQRQEVAEYVEDYWHRNQWDDIFDYERVRLFYWEHRMSTWNSASTLLENDWAFNTYLLLNCRKLLEMGFCLAKYARDKNYLTRYVVKELWPELLFRIENSERTLFDYYEIDPCGKVMIKDNFKVKSSHPQRVLLAERTYGVLFGFDKIWLGATDFCELEISPSLLGKKHLQIKLSAPINSEIEEGRMEAYVRIGDKDVYVADLTEIIKGVRTLNISSDEPLESLVIGTRCLKTLNTEVYGNYTMLNVEALYVSDEPFSDTVSVSLC